MTRRFTQPSIITRALTLAALIAAVMPMATAGAQTDREALIQI